MMRRGSLVRPAGDVVLCLHVVQLFHVGLNPLLNERRVSGVNFQVNTTYSQEKEHKID